MNLFKSFLVLALFFNMSFSATRAGYNYTDNHPESKMPPGGLTVNEVPQFVILGFDDNSRAGSADSVIGGIYWVDDMLNGKVNPSQSSANSKTFDGRDVKATFYCNLESFESWQEDGPSKLIPSIRHIFNNGHEVANHTFDHWRNKNTQTILSQSLDSWKSIITHNDECATRAYLEDSFLDTAADWQINQELDGGTYGSELPLDSIRGFRAPYLAYTEHTMTALKDLGFWYDCSIEDGSEDPTNDGTNFRWPYTLDNASSSANATAGDGTYGHNAITATSGLWELPNCPLAVPSDLQGKVGGKTLITGLDYNLFDKTQYGYTDTEVLQILKYNLDQRLSGNRAPFMIGLHSQFYFDSWASQHANVTGAQMRKCVEDFVDYCISKKDVRVVRGIDVIEWCRNPVGLSETANSSAMNNKIKDLNLKINNGIISFNQSDIENVSMKLFTVNGKLVAQKRATCKNEIQWNVSKNVNSGVYILNVELNNSSFQQKINIR